jgi:hypothetical protein
MSLNFQLEFKERANKRKSSFKGVWLIKDQDTDPDIILYYSHGIAYNISQSPHIH